MIRRALPLVAALGCGSALANTCEAPVVGGATDQTVYVEFIDNTTGLPATGLVWNGSGIDLEYVRTGATAVNITEATQTTNGAHSDGGFVDVGHGRYRLDLPDAAVAVSAREVIVQGILTGYTMLPCVVAIDPAVDVAKISTDATAANNLEALFDLVVGQSGSYAPFGIKGSGTAQAYTAGTPSVTLASGETFGTDTLVGNILWVRGSDQGYWQEEAITTSSGDIATLEEAYAVAPTGTLSYILWGVPEVTAAAGSTDWTGDERTALRAILGIPPTGTTPADPSEGILDTIRDDTTALPSDPADASVIAAALTIIDDFLDTEMAAVVTATAAASIRTALGLASANIDTQFSGVEGGITYNAAWDAEIQSEVADALAAIFLDQLLANTYNPAAPPGASDSLLEDLVENDGGVTQFNANALEDAPTGEGESLSAIAEAVWEFFIEGAVSAQCAMAVQMAEAAGNYEDVGQVRTFYGLNGSTPRVIGTMALDGTARTATSVSCVGL